MSRSDDEIAASGFASNDDLMIEIDVVDDVSVVTMRSGENRFNAGSVARLTSLVAEASERRRPLVITGDGKFFSNGLDLDWIRGDGSDDAEQMFADLYSLMADLLVFPGITVAAINGHAFGAGLILSACTDYRVMRSDRGYFCFPEVDLGMAMSDEFDAIIKATLPTEAMFHALITGHRYGGEEARAVGLVHATASEDDLLGLALDQARRWIDKDGDTIGRIKAKHHQVLAALLRG